MEIGSDANSIETREAHEINGEFDMDHLSGTLNFKLPYLLPGQKNLDEGSTALDITRLKKYDTVNLYFHDSGIELQDERESDILRNDENGTQVRLRRVFFGFIKGISLSKGKGNINYSISAVGTLGLAEERNLAFERKTGELQNLLVGVPQDNQLNNEDIGILQLTFGDQTNVIIPEVQFIDLEANTLFVDLQGGKNLQSVLNQIRENYAVIIHQEGNGTLTVMTPFFLLQARQNEHLNFNAWAFELEKGNVFTINYGDLTSNINSVVVLGYPPNFGVAVDPITVQLNAGSGNTPSEANFNYLIFEQRDLVSDEDCQKVARQKLLEIMRNFAIKFKVPFHPNYSVGQPLTINDNDRFTDGQVWIMKAYSFNISKDDVSCDITAYAHALDVFPEAIVIDPTGIADVDALEFREKTDDPGTWEANL